LATGTIDVVCNCAILTEGWDSPAASCLILARPTKSIGLYRHMVGRVLRPAPGKVDALILDHSGAVFQHGFPDDEIVWTLHEDRRAENKTQAARSHAHKPALTDCPECHAIRYEGKPCVCCGWTPRPKGVPVEVADGDLNEVRRDRSVIANVNTADDKLRFYRQLR
jgi:DNA repair protein RadD